MTPPAARFLSSITPAVLKTHLAGSPLPLHIGESLTAQWAARSKWRLNDGLAAIRAVGEDREVEIEVGKPGRGYLDPDFQRIHMGLGKYVSFQLRGFGLAHLTIRTIPRRLHPGQNTISTPRGSTHGVSSPIRSPR
jgi:hypothetical protein